MSEIERIKDCFCGFIEGALVDADPRAFDHCAEDVISVGMGDQGIVSCKRELLDIAMSIQKNAGKAREITIQYSHMQIRHYGDDYASINAVISVNTNMNGKTLTSRMGQCASMRKFDGDWKLLMLQATPLSMELDELDAYPLAFAEGEIENYRAQELLLKYKKSNMIAFYKVDVTANLIEEHRTFKERSHLPVSRSGAEYEKELFQNIAKRLEGITRLEFVQNFSISNLIKKFYSGHPEISMEYEAVQPDGTKLWRLTDVYMSIGANDRLKAYFYFVDIDEEKKKKLDLEYRAEMDMMTGLYNKAVTAQKITDLIDAPLPYDQGAFLIIDIDDFKQVNDTYGHAAGDEVIKKIAQILKNVFGKEHITGRVGGDEFCVFYTVDPEDGAFIEKLEYVLDMVHKIQLPDKRVIPSVSIGIANRSCENFDEIFRKADKALYIRKQEYNKDGYTFYKNKT